MAVLASAGGHISYDMSTMKNISYWGGGGGGGGCGVGGGLWGGGYQASSSRFRTSSQSTRTPIYGLGFREYNLQVAAAAWSGAVREASCKSVVVSSFFSIIPI